MSAWLRPLEFWVIYSTPASGGILLKSLRAPMDWQRSDALVGSNRDALSSKLCEVRLPTQNVNEGLWSNVRSSPAWTPHQANSQQDLYGFPIFSSENNQFISEFFSACRNEIFVKGTQAWSKWPLAVRLRFDMINPGLTSSTPSLSLAPSRYQSKPIRVRQSFPIWRTCSPTIKRYVNEPMP